MSGLLPVAVYGLKVPPGDVLIPALEKFRATFRVTMAAIDPSATPEHIGTANGDTPPRATLKIIYREPGPGSYKGSDIDSEEEDYLRALLEGRGSETDEDDEESSSDEEEKNGGPSDPAKSKKARKQAAVEQLIKSLATNDSDDQMEDGASAVNGVVSNTKKGKAKATDGEEEAGGEDDDDEGMPEMRELVLCTLDPSKNYQQPLDLTVTEDQHAGFIVSGTHAIYLTGNYVIEPNKIHNHQHEVYDGEDDSEDYDLSPDEDELDDEDESDELDALVNPRITDLASEEDEVPKLVDNGQPAKKGKNKRAAEDSDEEPANLDEMMTKALKPAEGVTNGEPKLSKKQMKKLKTNAGKAAEAVVDSKYVKEETAAKDSSSPKSDKKVQFAKNLEQGPASATKVAADSKAETSNEGDKSKATLGVRTVQGIKVEDKKLGKGPAAKKGAKVGMRYIGKLEDGKVFDANKKGAPFTFKLGAGEVIKGWDIGVAGMSIGGERRITVPAALAYGSKALPGIPANSNLIFEVKLLNMK